MIILEILVAVVTIGTALVALVRWVGRVDRNTDATNRLTAAFELFTRRIDDRLTDHETRISRLEGHDG